MTPTKHPTSNQHTANDPSRKMISIGKQVLSEMICDTSSECLVGEIYRAMEAARFAEEEEKKND